MSSSIPAGSGDLKSYNNEVFQLQLEMNKEYTRGSFMQALANNQKRDFR